MKSLVDLDLNQNKLQNAVIGGGTAAPSNPVEGQIYFNTSSDTAFIYDGSDWIPLDGSNSGNVTDVQLWQTQADHESLVGEDGVARINNRIFGHIYGECSTALDTAAKTVTLTSSASDFKLASGGIVSIYFTNGVTRLSTALTLKIGDTAALSIHIRGYATNSTNLSTTDLPTGAYIVPPKGIGTFVYSGDSWDLISVDLLSVATTTSPGTMSASDKTKLNGIAAGAEVNQNAFGTVMINTPQTTISAASKSDIFRVTAGDNVTLSRDSTTSSLQISATDTKYTAATAAPGKVASSSSQGSSTNYARQDHTHGIDLATGTNNGEVKIAGTDVAVKGLQSAAYLQASNDPSSISPQGTGVLPTGAAVNQAISGAIGAADAMRFKGTVGTASGATTASLPTSGVKRGDTYKVVTLSSHPTIPWSSIGVGEGPTLENGDIVIALIDSATRASSDWTVAQTNIDGAVTASTTTTNGYLAKFTGDKIVANGPQLGSSTTTFLRNDGTWATPSGTAPTYTSFTGNPTANATPGFGDTVTVSQISQSTTGQVSGTDRTITIPSATATNSTAGLMSAEDKATLQYISQVISQSVTGVPIAYGGEATLTAGQTSKTISLSLRIGTETILCQPLTLSAYDNNGNQIMVNVVKHNSGSTYDFTVSIPTAVSYDITLRYTYSKALQ